MCSTITAQLPAIVGKGTNFNWTPIQKFNFLRLKGKLVLVPILQYPMHDGNYQMKTNASNTAISGVLRIFTEEGYLMVAYKSSKLTDGEWSYPIHNKEILTMVYCV